VSLSALSENLVTEAKLLVKRSGEIFVPARSYRF